MTNYVVTVEIPTTGPDNIASTKQEIAHNAIVSMAREYVESGANIEDLEAAGVKITVEYQHGTEWEQLGLWGDAVPLSTLVEAEATLPISSYFNSTPAKNADGTLRAYRSHLGLNEITVDPHNVPIGSMAYDSTGQQIVMTDVGWWNYRDSMKRDFKGSVVKGPLVTYDEFATRKPTKP